MIILGSSVATLHRGLQTQRSWDEILALPKMQTFGSQVTKSKEESSCRTGRVKPSFPTTWTRKFSLKKKSLQRAEIPVFGKKYRKNKVPQCILRYFKEDSPCWKGIALFLLRLSLLSRRAEQKFPECCWTCVIVSAFILSILSFKRKPGHKCVLILWGTDVPKRIILTEGILEWRHRQLIYLLAMVFNFHLFRHQHFAKLPKSFRKIFFPKERWPPNCVLRSNESTIDQSIRSSCLIHSLAYFHSN